MYIVSPTYVSILGCGGNYLNTFMLVDTDFALPKLVFFQKIPDWMYLMGVPNSVSVLVPLDNLEPSVVLSGELSGTLKFGGRITPGGGYYFTNGTTTMLVNSAVGTCVYKSAPYRFPYHFAYDGEHYGDKIYKGKMPKLFSVTEDDMETISEDWLLEYDSSKVVNVKPYAPIGWWQKTEADTDMDLPNGGGLYGKYIGMGAYTGRKIIVGGATWMRNDGVKFVQKENLDDSSHPNYGDFIYDAHTGFWWLNGEVFDEHEWTDTPYQESAKFEYLDAAPTEGEDATVNKIIIDKGASAPKYGTETAVWAGYMGDVAKNTTYVCDAPVWRERKD